MRHVPTALLASLVASAVSQAGGVTKLPPPPKPEWVTVQADPVQTTLALDVAATWALLDAGPTADLRPSADGKTAVFAAVAPGRYRVVAAAEKEFHLIAVVVPDPPQPMPPGPGPKPPEPQPPAPSDPLVKKFQEAFDAEVLPREKKAEAIRDKVELYKQAAVLALDPEVKTSGQLLSRVRKAADTLNTDTLLVVRKAVRAELQAAMPEDVPLADGSRKKAADLFTRIKAALEQVK